MKAKWIARIGANWYPVLDIKDSGIPVSESGGGNYYTLQYSDKIQWIVHQSYLCDLDEDN